MEMIIYTLSYYDNSSIILIFKNTIIHAQFMAQCYKTFYARKLRVLEISFVWSWQAFSAFSNKRSSLVRNSQITDKNVGS